MNEYRRKPASSLIGRATLLVWGALSAPAGWAVQAFDDFYDTPHNTPLVVVAPGVLANDDPQGDLLSVIGNLSPANGAVVMLANGSFTYTPNPGYVGTDVFEYQVRGLPSTDDDTAIVHVTVAPPAVNLPPSATPQAVVVEEDASVAVTLSGSDPDGDSLTFAVVAPPSQGSLSGVAPNLTYTPNPDYFGPDSFTFVVNDGTLDSSPATVSITVNPVNDPPSAQPQSVTVDEDASIAIVLTGSDPEGDALTFAIVTGPANGVLSGAPPNVSYTPNPNSNGADAFTFTVSDGAATSSPATVSITVNQVNDAPVVANPIGTVSTFEDGPDIVIDLALVFADVDIATSGDVLTFAIDSIGNGALFSSSTITGSSLRLVLAADQNGSSTVAVRATDLAGASVVDTALIEVSAVNDVPLANNDVVTISENSSPILISVLANDYLAEEPTLISRAGVDGFSESTPTTLLDQLGNPVTAPNGAVVIVGNQVEYTPKAFFNGIDTFTYTITDNDGDEATATVTVTVTPANNPPVGIPERLFTIPENSSLVVAAANGLLLGAYDPDNALVDASGNAIVTQTIRVTLLSLPLVGTLTIDEATGSFAYDPPVNFDGEVSFTYRLWDGVAASEGAPYRIRINVLPALPPPPPPPPGEVAVTFNLSNMPLEQSTGVPPNVMVVMDDSGSMDWHMILSGLDDGIAHLSNNSIANRSRVTNEYTYLWDLPNATYPAASTWGRILPTPEALTAAGANHASNQYGLWRMRNHLYNSIYYNPAVRYTPWVGHDQLNQDFADAVPSAIRIDPVDTNPARVMNILTDHSYQARGVPRWVTGGGSDNINVTVYIPHYYTTTATPPLAWNDAHSRVEIRAGTGPLPGGLFPGGTERTDCALDDDDPLTCTYAQEIQNFANWFQYYRSRELITKASMGKVVAQVQNIRIGYETISNTTREPIRDMNDLYSEGNKKALLDNIYAVNSFGGTPLRQALDRAGRKMACEIAGDCPRLPAPAGFCQQNFALLFTDGYWNGGAGATGNQDANTVSPFDGGRYADSWSATLADTAMYHYKRDMHPDFENRVPVSARDILGAPPGTFPANDPFMHQHMKTYAIAFGVEGTIDPASVPANPATPFAWPDPFAGNLEKIDDLVHAAVNGRGRFLNASNATDLQAALESAFLEFTQAASSTSSAAFNSTSLEEGTLLYRGFYDLRFNTGELTATRVNSDGSLAATPLWRASEQLEPANKAPDDRVIVTWDRANREGIAFRHSNLTPEQQAMLSAQQVGFLRGERSAESPLGPLRAREATGAMLGDIVNSSPVFVGPPRSINRDQAPFPIDDLYSEFASDRASRTPVVYVGANDGILHGFHAATGEELFGYVPHKITDATTRYRNVLADFTSQFYQHRYYIDLSPRLNDVYIRTPSSPLTKSWRTILVGGLGAGGKGYFALDVTDPATQYADETSAQNAVLWEFTDQDDSYPLLADGTPLGGALNAITDPFGAPVKDLGFALAEPTIAMSNADDGGSPARKEWVALFGNGINSTAGRAALFMLFLDRGIDGWDDGDFIKLDTGFGVPLPPHPLAGFPNGLGTPAAVDLDLNGTVDRVYAGDRLGNLFRFEVGSSDPDDWTVTRLFTASFPVGATSTVQPILTQPLVIKHPTEDGFLIVFGTGSYVTRDDSRSEDIQSIYAIWDRGESSPATARADTRSRRLVEQTLANIWDDTLPTPATRRLLSSNSVVYTAQNCATADCSDTDDEPGVYGWYIDLDPPRATTSVSGGASGDTAGRAPPGPQYPGERAIRRMLFRNGNVVTTTVLPSLDDFSCFGTRPGAVMLFSALSGGDPGRAVIDFNNDGVIDSGDMITVGGVSYAAGILFNQSDLDGSLVDLSTLGGSGGTDFLFVSGGRDTVAYLIESNDDQRAGRLSWRELDLTD